MPKFIFVTGGVVSALGKGIASASLGYLMKTRGFSVTLQKCDPYLNVDPGTMSPFQHGEVFVTDDGAETDLDLGHYERFVDVDLSQDNNVTAGQIYDAIITKERRGDYLGGTVQVIPHVTDEIKAFILDGNDDYDFVLCEIGGTVGDIEATPFFEAIRQLGNELPRGQAIYIHFIACSADTDHLRTVRTQHAPPGASVRRLRETGSKASGRSRRQTTR